MADLYAYWARHPPVHEMVAAYLGVAPTPAAVTHATDPADPSGIGALIAQFPNGFVPAGG